MSMPIMTLTSASSNTSHSHTLPSSENRKKSRDASFSSYLDIAEETFVLQLSGTNTRGIIGKTKTQDREIDVFDAEKYFREGLKNSPRSAAAAAANNKLHHHLKKKDEPFEIVSINETTRPRVATPSISSESSWNSRGALLRNVARNQQQQPRKTNRKSFLTSIRCNCSCGDKDSVDIDDYVDETVSRNALVNGKSKQGGHNHNHNHNHKISTTTTTDYHHHRHSVRTSLSDNVKFDELTTGMRVNSNGHFSFPILNQGAKEELVTAARKSLEVFGSPVMMENGKNCLRVEKKLMTWDAIAPPPTNDDDDDQQQQIIIKSSTSTTPPITIINSNSKLEMGDDDHAKVDNDDSDNTDASSDLFEIESLSKGDPFLSRTGSDGMSGSVPTTTCYAPSEASVEWSVITATTAADFSVLSDSEELRLSSNKMGSVKSRNGHLSSSKELTSKRYSSILSVGCKNQKAVGVAEDAYGYRAYNDHHQKECSNSSRRFNNNLQSESLRFKDENNNSRLAGLFRRQSFDVSQPRSANAVHLFQTK